MPKYNSITTLAEIRAQNPCDDYWIKLLAHLGKTKADDEPLPLLTILASNGLDDALWTLRCPSLERLSRHFIAILRRDDAGDDERADAWSAAREAARDAAEAAPALANVARHDFLAFLWRVDGPPAMVAAFAAARDAQRNRLREMIAA